MANGPGEKTLVYSDIVDLLVGLGSEFSDNCRSALCINKPRQGAPETPPATPAAKPEEKKPETPAGAQPKKPGGGK